MKKILILFIVLLQVSVQTRAQSCCEQGNDGFGMLAMTDDFKNAHLSPLPLDYTPAENSSMIQFNTQDGKGGSAFYVPSDKPTDRALIIFHEWWGLNDYIKKEAERWQKLLGNVDVYAIDLYEGQVAADPSQAARLSDNLSKNQKRGEYIVQGLLSKIGPNSRIATLGWCLGGTWSFTAARLAENRAVGCVMYYGFPEKDEKVVKEIKADVLYIRASQDKFISKDAVDQFEKQVLSTGKQFERHEFPAEHAFANPSNPQFKAKEAVEAEQFVIAFLKKRMQLE